MGSNKEEAQAKVNARRRRGRPKHPDSGTLESTRCSPSNKGQLSAREYSTNRISQRQRKEQQTRNLERLNRPKTLTGAATSRPPLSQNSNTAQLRSGPLAGFLDATSDGSPPEVFSTAATVSGMTTSAIGSSSATLLGSKNERKVARTRFPIIAGPGERQRFITTFLDGRINDGMIAVEKASIRAQELSTVVAPSGANRLSAVEEAVSILTCFTKDEDTLACAYLIDLVRFEKLSLESVHNEFGQRAGSLVEQILVMENQPKFLVRQLELLSHPLHLEPVEPWVMVVLSFVLVEMFQQECIQLEWVEQAALALGHHQGLLSMFAAGDMNSPEAAVVGLLLLGTDLVQENVAFRGWHLADLEDVLKRMQIRRLACCDGLIQHGLKALVSVYTKALQLVVSAEQFSAAPAAPDRLAALQRYRVHAKRGLLSHSKLPTANFAAASVAAVEGSATAQALVYLLRIDPEQASLQAIESASNSAVASAAAQVAMASAELVETSKLKSLSDAMNHDMDEDALLATLADVHAQLVHASVESPSVLRECVKDVIELFGQVSPAKWHESHAMIAASISTEIELSVAALELWTNCRSGPPSAHPVSTALVEQATKYVQGLISKGQAAKSKLDPAATMQQMWQLSAVLWRLSGSEAVIAAAMIHQISQLSAAKTNFEGLRHMFSKEVAALVLELDKSSVAVPEQHAAPFSNNLSQNALLVELCIRHCYFVQTGTWRMDQRRRLLSKAMVQVRNLPLDALSNAHHILLRALRLQSQHDSAAQQIVSLCLPCSVMTAQPNHPGVADWPIWQSQHKWMNSDSLDPAMAIQPVRLLEVIGLTRSLHASHIARTLYSTAPRPGAVTGLNGPKLHPTPPASRESYNKSRDSPLPPMGRASPIEMDSFGTDQQRNPAAEQVQPDSHLHAATPPLLKAAELENNDSALALGQLGNTCQPAASQPMQPSQPPSAPGTTRRRPTPRNNVGTIGQPVPSKNNVPRPPSKERGSAPRAPSGGRASTSRVGLKSRERQFRAAESLQHAQMAAGDQAILDKLKDVTLWQMPVMVAEQLRQLSPPILTVVLVEALYRLGAFVGSSLPRAGCLLTESLGGVVRTLEQSTQSAHSEQAIVLTGLHEMLNLHESAPQALELCCSLMFNTAGPRSYKLTRTCRPRTPSEQLANSLVREAVAREPALQLNLLAAECDAAILRTVGGERTAVTAAYLCQMLGANKPITLFCNGEEQAHTDAVDVAVQAQVIVSEIMACSADVSNVVAQMSTSHPAAVTLVLARMLRWIVKPHFALQTLPKLSQFHQMLLAILVQSSSSICSRPQSLLASALLFRKNMHTHCVALLAEVRGSRVRAPNMYEGHHTLHAIATFTKGAYLAKSLEESTPFFFNAARMAATVQWIGAGNDGIAAALLGSLCRDHERTLEDVEEGYTKFSHGHPQISTLPSEVRSVVHVTLTAEHTSIEATSSRLYGSPAGLLATFLILVFALHDLCDLDSAPEAVAREYLQKTARDIEQIVMHKLEYYHFLLIETIRLVLAGYGMPKDQCQPDFDPSI